MEITYVGIIMVVTYIMGSITKAFIKSIPEKYIPIQNVVIGITSGLICYFGKIEPNLIQALFLCITATMGAGGVYDLLNMNK